MRITAAVARGDAKRLSIETLELEDPRPGEVRVRLVATGVCHTDIKVMPPGGPTPKPVVLGHEGAGVVARVGAGVTKVAPGDHVVMSFAACGACPSCRDHAPAYCHDMRRLNFGGARADGTTPLSKDGAPIHGSFFGQSSFATHAVCREGNVVKVRKDAPLERLGPLGCGVQTGAGAVLNSFKVKAGQSIAVFGAGSVGLSAVMAARLAGAGAIVAVDVVPERLALAAELGATATADARAGAASDAVRAHVPGGVDYALDTTASAAVLREALLSLAPRGVCGLVAAPGANPEVTVDVLHLLLGGRSLRGIVQGDSTPDEFIPRLIDLHMDGRLPFDRLITFYPFERINDAIRDSESGAAIKPVLRFA